MNVADSQRVGSSLEHLGYTFTDKIEEADESQPCHQPDGMSRRCARRGQIAGKTSLCGCLLASFRPGTVGLVP